MLEHSYKIGKNSLEIQAEPVFPRAYIKNQAILEATFPYFLWTYFFTFLEDNDQVSFLGQDRVKPGSNCAIIACDLLHKHKLATFHKSKESKTNRL